MACLIDLNDAGWLRQLRRWVQAGRIKLPEGVYRESRRKTDKLCATLEGWERKYAVVVGWTPQRKVYFLTLNGATVKKSS